MNDVHKGARPGDKVRAQPPAVEGIVESADAGLVTVVTGDGRRIEFDSACTVKVLKRADDPDLGIIHRVAPSHDGKPGTAIKVGARLSEYPSQRWVWVIVETGEVLTDDDLTGLEEPLGAAPGTPAWVREQAEVEHSDEDPTEQPARGPVPLSEIFPPEDQPRTLAVHPHVWRPLVSYLFDTGVVVEAVPGGHGLTYRMRLLHGEWPS